MKTIIIFLLFHVVCLNAYCQEGKKFHYEPLENSYIVSLKSEKPISKDARQVLIRSLDQLCIDTYWDIVEKSIHPDKLNQMSRSALLVNVRFSTTGKMTRVRFLIRKEYIDILNDRELYAFYCNLEKFEVDMSKLEIEYPQNWIEGTEAFWSFSFPIKRGQQP